MSHLNRHPLFTIRGGIFLLILITGAFFLKGGVGCSENGVSGKNKNVTKGTIVQSSNEFMTRKEASRLLKEYANITLQGESNERNDESVVTQADMLATLVTLDIGALDENTTPRWENYYTYGSDQGYIKKNLDDNILETGVSKRDFSVRLDRMKKIIE